MLNFSLIIVACLVDAPTSCVRDRIGFEAVNGLPTECSAFAASVLPDWAARHPDRRITYSCRPVSTLEAQI